MGVVTTAADHAVVIAGGGPTGLMLGAELTLAGADVVIVERRPTQAVESSRAGGLYPRTLEVLDQRGVADRFVAEGTEVPALSFAGRMLDISDFPTRFNAVLALWQRDTERILADWVLDDLGVPIRRGVEVAGFRPDDDGVDVELSDGTTVRAQYLVGCDGGRSAVRRGAGIDFAGWDPTVSFLIAEADLAEEPPAGPLPEGGGIGPVDFLHGGNPYRIVVMEDEVDHADEPTLADLRTRLVTRFGTDFGVHDPTYISRFGDTTRQATTYRRDRVLLAGDAAHVHSPHGGQGLNTGVQDAVNLGWKLARVVAGTSPDDLLDTYHDERHPVAARVLQNTMAAVTLSRTDERHRAVASMMGDLLALDGPRTMVGAMLTALDVHYDLGGDHPLVGRRMPDLDLDTADGPTRTYALLHDARPVLVDLGGRARVDVGPWSTRLRVVDASHDGPWELPVIGAVEAPEAVLIRPDGHVAWAGAPTDPELPDALARWFGPADAR